MPRGRNGHDILGRFGSLVVIEQITGGKPGGPMCRVRCDCGVEFEILRGNLTAGRKISCGRRGLHRIKRGDRFGRLIILGKSMQPCHFRALCDCGNKTQVHSSALYGKATRSCGCLSAETASKVHTTHGYSKYVENKRHYLYSTWASMKNRCSSPGATGYHNYGGRGISVCQRWLNFENFRDDIIQNLGERPEGMSIDRIDNDGNYELENVRWADRKTQRMNSRRDLIVST